MVLNLYTAVVEGTTESSERCNAGEVQTSTGWDSRCTWLAVKRYPDPRYVFRGNKKEGRYEGQGPRGVQVTAASRRTDAAVRRTANNVFAAHKEI